MSMLSVRLSAPGITLGLVSAALMLSSLTAYPQNQTYTSPGKASSGASSASSGTASAGAGCINRADEKLMADIAQANLAEISTAKLAQEKSQNDQIKGFAQKMADDHTKALDELKQLAQAKGVTLPSEPSRQQKAMEKRLSSLSGDKFDKQYLEQVGDRSSKDTHKLLKRASDKAQDTDLKNYASKTLGVVESHQQLAEEAERNLKSSSHGKSGTGSSESGSSGGKTPSSSTGTE